MDTLELGTTTDGRTIGLPLRFANRHGVVTGATGTGKTVTLQRMAEQFSAAGVPVFAADVKGDLSGIATGSPAVFWDIFGRKGHPIRTSVQEIGATLMARMLGLNEVQAGALAVLFARAEDRRQFILTLEDLRWALVDLAEDREAVSQQYGNVTASSINTIQRQILALEAQGAGKLFGEPAFDVMDFLTLAADGRGPVNLLWADKLMEAPKLYGTLLLWLLTELYRRLPEVGDVDKPKLVFFFDEAHLLFKDAPKPLLEHIERVVRLVRSKGVGVFFVSQSQADIPDSVLAQLGNRVQHALRAYTAREQRMIKAAVKSFRPNKAVDVQAAVLEMGVGEALVSCLEADGVPAPVERVKIGKPAGQIGPLSELERDTIIGASAFRTKYPAEIDDHAAHEAFRGRMFAARGLPAPAPRQPPKPIDWNDVFSPLKATPPKRTGWKTSTKVFAVWMALVAVYGLAAWVFPG